MVKIGRKPRAKTLTVTPRSLTATLHFDFKSVVKEYFRVYIKANTAVSVYAAINLKITLEGIYCIFLEALLLGQPTIFLYCNSHAENMSSDYLSSFLFFQEIILTGNNF